jgi:hypothetical protein
MQGTVTVTLGARPESLPDPLEGPWIVTTNFSTNCSGAQTAMPVELI